MIVGVVNQKGGVGKTTLVANIGAYLSTYKSKRILLIDADTQGSLSGWICDPPPEIGLYELLTSRKQGRASRYITVINQGWQLGLVAGGQELRDAYTLIATSSRPYDDTAKRIRSAAKGTDYTFIDFPPSRSPIFEQMLYACDAILIPTILEALSVKAVLQMRDTILHIEREQGQAPRLLGIVPNLARRSRGGIISEHRDCLRELTKAFKATVWPPIRQAAAMSEACHYRESIWTYAPDQAVATDLLAIIQRLIENTA